MTKKAALYIRVSTVHQVDKDSLPMQRKDLISYAHYVLGIDDYDVFEDAGYSGKNVERPAFQEMMRRCRLGEFSHVLVWKIDRISRNIVDFSLLYEELKKLNVSLVSKNEQFDTSTAMGEASLKILLVFAELERKTTSERVAATMITRAKEGKWNGANIPYGYDWCEETKYPAINEQEAEVVKAIFENYASMRSLVKVASWLTDNGIPTKRGGKWSTQTIRQMLLNPFYIGTLRYNYKQGPRGKTKPQEEWIVYKNAHPPLVDEALFENCQRILASNSTFTSKEGKHRVVTHTNVFAGVMRCGHCGRTIKAQSGKPRASGIRYTSYYCSARYEHNSTCTNNFTYHDEKIGNFVFNYIRNLLNARHAKIRSTKDLQRFLLHGKEFTDVVGIANIDNVFISLQTGFTHKQGNAPTQEDTIKADSIRSEIAKKERALERLNKLFLYDEEAMPEAEYIVTKNKLRQEILQLNEKLSQMATSSAGISDATFIANASSYILRKVFDKSTHVDYTELVTLIDKPALKEFVQSSISQITANNGQITSIEFANGSIHYFAYK